MTSNTIHKKEAKALRDGIEAALNVPDGDGIKLRDFVFPTDGPARRIQTALFTAIRKADKIIGKL